MRGSLCALCECSYEGVAYSLCWQDLVFFVVKTNVLLLLESLVGEAIFLEMMTF